MATNKLGYPNTETLQLAGNGHAYATYVVAAGTLIAPESGICTQMFLYIVTINSNNKDVDVGVYDSIGGIPNNLLGQGSKVGSWSTGWNEITMSAVSITGGNTYHVVALPLSGDDVIGYSDVGANAGNRDLSVAELQDPWVEQAATAYCLCLYAQYEGVAGGIVVLRRRRQ